MAPPGPFLIEVAKQTHRITMNNKQRKVSVVSTVRRVKSAKMDSVTALYKDLKSEWDKSAPNLRKCGSLLDQLKVIIVISSILIDFHFEMLI